MYRYQKIFSVEKNYNGMHMVSYLLKYRYFEVIIVFFFCKTD